MEDSRDAGSWSASRASSVLVVVAAAAAAVSGRSCGFFGGHAVSSPCPKPLLLSGEMADEVCRGSSLLLASAVRTLVSASQISGSVFLPSAARRTRWCCRALGASSDAAVCLLGWLKESVAALFGGENCCSRCMLMRPVGAEADLFFHLSEESWREGCM